MKSLIILFVFTTILFANIAKVTAINGEAIVFRENKEIQIKKDFKIFEKDIIKTKKNAKLQLIFKDNTIISLGQNSTFEIKQYLFSNTKKPSAKFKISKGIFKSITGKIGKIAPKNFKLKTQNATIGIRGTTIIGEISKERDTIICSSGQIVVSTPKGEVIVNKGEKTIAKKQKPPTKAIKVSKKVIKTLEQKVDYKTPSKAKTTTKIEQTDNKNDSTNKKITKVKPKIKNTPSIKKELPLLSNIDLNKDRWGDWNRKKFYKDLPKEAIPKDILKPPTTMLKKLQELRDRAGGVKLTYNGKVSGFVDQYKISDKDNYIKLKFDLGVGKVNGDMGFSANNQKWSATIENGKIDQRGKFDFGLINQKEKIKGSGDGLLSGKRLENANGVFSMINSQNQRAFGSFSAKKEESK